MQMIRRLLFFLTLTLVLGWSSSAYSQMSEGGLPPSFAFSETVVQKMVASKPFTALLNFDVNELKKEDAMRAGIGVPLRIGVVIPVNLFFSGAGGWVTLPDGNSVWQLEVAAEGAIALGLYYDEFYIPEGGKLFIYSKDRKHVIGAYTSKTNPGGKLFATEFVAGDNVILEYVPPTSLGTGTKPSATTIEEEGGLKALFPSSLQKSSATIEQPRIVISGINYGYDHLKVQYNDRMGASGSCQVNINCPEGDEWQDQKKGVYKTVMKIGNGTYYCSGTVLNNTKQDLTPLLLTACHCIEDASPADFNQHIYYFHYEQPECGNVESDITTTKTMVGSQLLAFSPLDGGSDGALLQLNQRIPIDYNVYYNGWDIKNEPALKGVGIHHPRGDVKKISTFTETAASTSVTMGTGEVGATNAHWQVYWKSTVSGWSVTEEGSSGSPLFNEEGLVVGTLTGGPGQDGVSNCDLPDNYKRSVYGKLWYHYDQSDNAMKPYLDPENTGMTKLPGTYSGKDVVADFTSDKSNVYASETVTFRSASVNAETLEWSFPGGNPSTSTDPLVEVTYNTPGTYDVTLIVNKGHAELEEKTKTVTGCVTVSIKQGEKQETIELGNGSATSSFPLGADQLQTFSSSIYKASEIGEARTITSLAWEATTAVARTRTVSVYLKEVADATQTAGTWDDEINGATLVYKSANSWNNLAGWTIINLTVPFAYSGTNNLKVIVQSTATASSELASANVKYTEASGTHISWTSSTAGLPAGNGTVDGNRPNIKITGLIPQAVASPVAAFALGKDNSFEEGFDEATSLSNWTVETMGDSPNTWKISNYADIPFHTLDPVSKYSALVPYDQNKIIDARLISKDITVPANSSFEFYALHGGYLGEAILSFSVSTDGGITWNQEKIIGGVEDPGLEFDWRKQTVDMSVYGGQTVKFLFRYHGIGNIAGIDGLKLYTPSTVTKVDLYTGDYFSPLNLSTGPVVVYDWSFTGATPAVSSDEQPMVRYMSPGTYDVSLNVRNNLGENNLSFKSAIVVKDRTPVAAFKSTGDFQTYPDYQAFIPTKGEVSFKDISENYPSSYEWSFTGGSPATSTANQVDVTYEAKGEYDVSLKVTNTEGSNEVLEAKGVKVGDQSGVWNIPKGDSGENIYQLNENSYVAGLNDVDLYAYAEKFPAPSAMAEIAEVDILYGKMSSADESIEVAVLKVTSDGTPGAVITSTQLPVSDIADGEYTTVKFPKPAAVNEPFFIVVTAPESANVAVSTSTMNSGENTMYCYFDFWGIGWITEWSTATDMYGVSLSMNIVPKVTYSELAIDKNELKLQDKVTAGEKINVTSNVSWKATPSAAWINITDVEAGSFTISAGNNNFSYRKGYVAVTAGGLTEIISVEQSMAAPRNVTATAISDEEVEIKWTADFAVSEDISDDFESHDAFKMSSGGQTGWGYMDNDGSATYGFEGIGFPGSSEAMAFIVFDPSQTTPPMTSSSPGIIAHSGNKFLASFAAVSGQNDDWLISPRLNFGTDFKFSFWAKSYMADYGLERFRVFYSTHDESDWIKVTAGDYIEAPVNWTLYEYTIPADAQYVAINCVSEDAFIFMVDDIFIGTGNAVTTAPAEVPMTGVSVNAKDIRKKKQTNKSGYAPRKQLPEGRIMTEEMLKEMKEKAIQTKKATRLKGIAAATTETMVEVQENRLRTALKFASDNPHIGIRPQVSIPDGMIYKTLKWTNNTYYNALGFGGVPFEFATRFDASSLLPYIGYTLESVNFIPYAAVDYTLKIYKNGNVVHSQAIPSFTPGKSIQNIVLDTPIAIDESFEDLIISIAVDVYTAADYPAAVDNTTNEPDKGAMVYALGGWMNLSDITGNNSYNWILSGVLKSGTVTIETSYNIYREDKLVGTTDGTDFTEKGITTGGDKCYTVKAVQKNVTEIESAGSDAPCVFLRHPITITADDIEKYIGDEFPHIVDRYTIEGFVEDDDLSYLSKVPLVSISPSYNINTDEGTYSDAILVSGAEDATNKYRFAYKYGKLIVKTRNSDTSIANVEINGVSHTELPSYYALDCSATGNEVEIVINTTDPLAKIELLGGDAIIVDNTITTRLMKPGQNIIDFLVVAHDGLTNEKHSITVEKYIPFDDLVISRWNNTLVVINNPANNGGYRFISYKWYRNGEMVGTDQAYSAGSGNKLNSTDSYYVQVTTDRGEVMRTCVANVTSVGMKVSVYPNMVAEGSSVTVEADLTNDLLENAVIKIYNGNGIHVSDTKVTGRYTQVSVQGAAGIYVLKFVSDQGFTSEMKVIKK